MTISDKEYIQPSEDTLELEIITYKQMLEAAEDSRFSDIMQDMRDRGGLYHPKG